MVGASTQIYLFPRRSKLSKIDNLCGAANTLCKDMLRQQCSSITRRLSVIRNRGSCAICATSAQRKNESLRPSISQNGLQMPQFDEREVERVAKEACAQLTSCRSVDFPTARWFAKDRKLDVAQTVAKVRSVC